MINRKMDAGLAGEIGFTVRGLPLHMAPDYLKPHMRGFDEFMAIGGTLDREGNQISAKWQRFRGGEAIDEIEVLIPKTVKLF